MPPTRSGSSGNRTARSQRSQNPHSQMKRPPSKGDAGNPPSGKGRKYASENERPDPSSIVNSDGRRRLSGPNHSKANRLTEATSRPNLAPRLSQDNDRHRHGASHPQAGVLRAPRSPSPRKRSATRLRSSPAVSKTTPSYPHQPLHGKYHNSEITHPGGETILDHTFNPSLSPRVKCMLLGQVSSLSKGKMRKRSESSRKPAAVHSRLKTGENSKSQKAKPYPRRTLRR